MDHVEALEALNKAYFQLIEDELTEYRAALTALERVYHLLPDSPERPITFPAIVRRSYDENFISDYLAYILDPARNGIGVEPLQAVLDLVGFDYSSVDFESVNIAREHTFSAGGRIDFLILVDDSLVIGIENKILSSEGEKQTTSYARSIRQEFKDRDRALIYLAPGHQVPSSKEFQHVSYSQLRSALRGIQYQWTEDVRRSFIWEDFLTHLEVYIAMNKGIPEISEKAKLYLENIKVIQDVQAAFEKDSQKLYDYLTAKIASSYDGGEWHHNKQSHAQFIGKHSWKNDKLTIFFRFQFKKEILQEDTVFCSLEVQGYGKEWNKSPLIDTFIDLFAKVHPHLPDEIRSREMKCQPGNRQWAIAYKGYDLKPDSEYIVKQFNQAVDDFSFLTDPVDIAVAEYKAKYPENVS